MQQWLCGESDKKDFMRRQVADVEINFEGRINQCVNETEFFDVSDETSERNNLTSSFAEATVQS